MLHDCRHSDTVLLNVGTVDVSSHNVFDIACNYCNLIDKVKSGAPECNIIDSVVPRRVKDKHLNVSIDNLNKSLRLICTRDAKCRYINVNPFAIDQNYCEDGLHFNYKGRQAFSVSLVDRIKQFRNFSAPVHQLIT